MILCDAPRCVRGLVHLPAGWANPCPVCLGEGQISFASLCKRIGECESTMKKICSSGRMRAKTAARILDKIAELLS